jgi:hypothetical protein
MGGGDRSKRGKKRRERESEYMVEAALWRQPITIGHLSHVTQISASHWPILPYPPSTCGGAGIIPLHTRIKLVRCVALAIYRRLISSESNLCIRLFFVRDLHVRESSRE